ncbi:MAG: hypothetical protein LBF69_00870 [Prevotellaceae bacterium]|jgi:hypothetical protein|nr:hypothetical protein [Prevotellaceae bacterium]
MRIVYRNLFPRETSPALADLQEGVITVNSPVFNKYDDFTKRYILLHEKGHIKLNTFNEIAADSYAFDALAGTEPYSLRNSVKALQTALPFTHPVHDERLRQQLIRALAWDAAHGNTNAQKELDEMNRYAYFEYTPYQNSGTESYNRYMVNLLNETSLSTMAEDFKISTSTLILLFGFIVFIFVLIFLTKKKV